jgi:hypothetical protein
MYIYVNEYSTSYVFLCLILLRYMVVYYSGKTWAISCDRKHRKLVILCFFCKSPHQVKSFCQYMYHKQKSLYYIMATLKTGSAGAILLDINKMTTFKNLTSTSTCRKLLLFSRHCIPRQRMTSLQDMTYLHVNIGYRSWTVSIQTQGFLVQRVGSYSTLLGRSVIYIPDSYTTLLGSVIYILESYSTMHHLFHS